MFPAKTDKNKVFIALNIAVLTVSDTRTSNTDSSGDLLQKMLEEDGHNCAERKIVKDNVESIRAALKSWIDAKNLDVILTTGGTGFSGFDVTPEAVEPLFNKKMDGFSALFHAYSSQKIGTSTMLSRATAGLAETTFIFCLPGSNGACRDAWQGIIRFQLDVRLRPCNLVEMIPRLAEHMEKPSK